MFDMADFDTLTHSEAGMPMAVLNPRSKRPVLNDDGNAVTITLLGRQSEVFRSTVKMLTTRQAETAAAAQASGNALPDAQTVRDSENTELLIACTRNWTFQRLDGEDFPCTPINVSKFWNDRRFSLIREAALNFMLTDINFLDPSAFGSKATPGTSSS